jgi:hypothetical protein
MPGMNSQIHALIAKGILKTGPLRPRSAADIPAIRAAMSARREARP